METSLTERQTKLGQFATDRHKTQPRKYTGNPYIQHCIRVAEKANSYGIKFGWEIGICHDLIEDYKYTKCTYDILYDSLRDSGYDVLEAALITVRTSELTDVYTHESYPELNRKKRKELEAERLWTISKEAQSVKYCDLIDNTESICNHDPKFAKLYLQEKKYILKGMRAGNSELLGTCELAIKLNDENKNK